MPDGDAAQGELVAQTAAQRTRHQGRGDRGLAQAALVRAVEDLLQPRGGAAVEGRRETRHHFDDAVDIGVPDRDDRAAQGARTRFEHRTVGDQIVRKAIQDERPFAQARGVEPTTDAPPILGLPFHGDEIAVAHVDPSQSPEPRRDETAERHRLALQPDDVGLPDHVDTGELRARHQPIDVDPFELMA
jgi:hypothetical protein